MKAYKEIPRMMRVSYSILDWFRQDYPHSHCPVTQPRLVDAAAIVALKLIG